ncbi:MAG: DUF58 domain-containing protein [Opitutales bacterium]
MKPGPGGETAKAEYGRFRTRWPRPSGYWIGLAAGLMPVSLWLGRTPAGLLGPVVLFALIGLLAAVDWAWGRRRLRHLDAVLLDMNRLNRGRKQDLPVHVVHRHGLNVPMDVALAAPRELGLTADTIRAPTPLKSGQWKRVDFQAQPTRRGQYTLEGIYVRLPTPARLWQLAAVRPCRATVRVFPNLKRERRVLSDFFLHRSRSGQHSQRLLGAGREFEEMRDYQTGDSFHDINWKASAHRSKLVTQLYRTERTQEIYIAFDTSRLSSAPSVDRLERSADGEALAESVLERFIVATLVMSLVAGRQGDGVGFIAFNDKVDRYMRARPGADAQQAILSASFDLQTRPVAPRFDTLFTFIRQRLRRRALIFFLTDLRDPVVAEQFCNHVKLITRRHLVCVIMLRPQGFQPLFDGSAVDDVPGLYQRLAGHYHWHSLMQTQRRLQRQGVSFGLVDAAQLCPEVINRYLDVKRRQAL